MKPAPPAPGPVLHSLEIHFDRVLTEPEWREVVEFARNCPFRTRLTAHARPVEKEKEPQEGAPP